MDIREIHIPLVVKDGKLVIRSSKDELPQFIEGAFAELRVNATMFLDQKEVENFIKDQTTKFLPKGTMVVAEVKRSGVPADLVTHLIKLNKSAWGVPFELNEDLKITLTSGKKGRLEVCECLIPCLGKLITKSINEAYTRISEKFEPERRSHTGNVFSKVYVGEKTGYLPLGKQRRKFESGLERIIGD
jgi:hypothetical protein